MPTTDPLRRQPEQDRSRRRVNAVLDAAQELVAERGTQPFTMTDIAARSGMSLTALYRYFPDRAAVVRALAVRMLEQDQATVRDAATASIGGTVEDSVRDVVHAYRQRDREQPFRAPLRAAVAADRELGLLDLADSRTAAASLVDAVAALTGRTDREALFRELLLATHLTADAVRLAELVDDRHEAELLVETYIGMLSRTLTGPA